MNITIKEIFSLSRCRIIIDLLDENRNWELSIISGTKIKLKIKVQQISETLNNTRKSRTLDFVPVRNP